MSSVGQKTAERRGARHLPNLPPAPFTVPMYPSLKSELAMGKFMECASEIHWFIATYRFLERWPLDQAEEQKLAESLDLSNFDCGTEKVYEARFEAATPDGSDFDVLFWIAPAHKEIWILHACKDSVLERLTKRRKGCHRLRTVKGFYHDKR